ncbi:hypothetical protein [Psychrobacillus sp. FSL H8-0487]|uniref:hypothetical protein n=1 Tax=Psychrobacillus sp. FSL H8-0487 TaxID=2921391 RepID=UPI0030F506E4
MNEVLSSKMVQAESLGKYIQDIWIIALVSVIFHQETNIVLPFLWIILQVFIVSCVQIIMSKTGPRPIIPYIVPMGVLLILFLFNSPLWLYIIGTGISIWRLQIRFNKIQDEQSVESNYHLSFFLVFLVVHFICLIIGIEDYIFPLYSIVILGIVIQGATRLYAVWISTNKQNSASLSHVAGGFSIGLVFVVGLSMLVYFTIPLIRTGFGFLLGKVMTIAIIPFVPLLEYLDKLLNKLEIKIPEEMERIPSEEQTELEPQEVVSETLGGAFPFELIFIVLAILAIILFLRFLMKNKPDELIAEPSVIHYLNKELEDQKEEHEHIGQQSLYKVDTSLLREKYQQFEVEASFYTYNRAKSETVRDWFRRMEWVVQDEFFQVYEEVRYGGQTISSEKAQLFQTNLKTIKNEFFLEKDV